QLAAAAVLAAEGSEPDLEPLRHAAGPRLQSADADPAADMAVDHRRRRDRNERRGDAVRRVAALEPCVPVRLAAAPARPGRAALRGRDRREREAENRDDIERALEQRDPLGRRRTASAAGIGPSASALAPSN